MTETTVQNYPGPYEIRIGYFPTVGAVQDIDHIQRLNVDLEGIPAQGDTFDNYEFTDKEGASGVSLDTLVEDWLTVFNNLYPNTMDIISCELWKYPTEQSFDAVFWSTYTPTANVGTGGAASQSAGQDIYTFRTSEGGIMKVVAMEDGQVPGPPLAYGSMLAVAQAVVDFILDGDGATYTAPFLARDTSYPFAAIRQYPGRNEALWKKRNGR